MSQNSKHNLMEKDILTLRNAWIAAQKAFCASNAALNSSAFGQPTRGLSKAMKDEDRAYKKFNNIDKRICAKYSLPRNLEVECMINAILSTTAGQEVA